MKAKAQSRVSNYQLGLPMPGVMCHTWGLGRGCAMAGTEGKVPFPCIVCCGQANHVLFSSRGHSGICKEHIYVCSQTSRHRGLLWEWPG